MPENGRTGGLSQAENERQDPEPRKESPMPTTILDILLWFLAIRFTVGALFNLAFLAGEFLEAPKGE